MSLAGEEGVPPLLSDEEGVEEREAPPHVRDPLDPDVPRHDAADDPPAEEEEEQPLPPPVSPPPLPEQPAEDPEE